MTRSQARRQAATTVGTFCPQGLASKASSSAAASYVFGGNRQIGAHRRGDRRQQELIGASEQGDQITDTFRTVQIDRRIAAMIVLRAAGIHQASLLVVTPSPAPAPARIARERRLAAPSGRV